MNESKLIAKIQANHPGIVEQVVNEAAAELEAATHHLSEAQAGFEAAQQALTEAQTRYQTAQADHAELGVPALALPQLVPINE